MQQSDAARNAITLDDAAVPINAALLDFSTWYSNIDGTEVWGNGATFDNVILGNAYKRALLTAPWPFWADRCYRTLKSLYPDVEVDRTGTHHNALADAETQALHLIKIMEKMK